MEPLVRPQGRAASGRNSIGRVSAFQAECCEFESRRPLSASPQVRVVRAPPRIKCPAVHDDCRRKARGAQGDHFSRDCSEPRRRVAPLAATAVDRTRLRRRGAALSGLNVESIRTFLPKVWPTTPSMRTPSSSDTQAAQRYCSRSSSTSTRPWSRPSWLPVTAPNPTLRTNLSCRTHTTGRRSGPMSGTCISSTPAKIRTAATTSRGAPCWNGLAAPRSSRRRPLRRRRPAVRVLELLDRLIR